MVRASVTARVFVFRRL